MNLFSTFNDVLKPDVLSRIAAYVDEPAEKATKAVEGLVFTIVGGLMKRTTSEIGVNQLFNHIKKGRYDGTLTDNLLTVLRDPAQTNTLITQGNDVISHLLPAMKSSIGSMISSYAGIRNSSAISLLGLTSTIVLHVLGKRVTDQKLDADGLASSLFSERESFVNAVPEEFMPRLVEKVGLQQIVAGMAMPARRTTVEAPARTAAAQPATVAKPVATVTRPAISYEPDDTSDENSSLVKWGMGALLALALGAIGFYVYQNTQDHADDKSAADISLISSDTVKTDTVSRSLAVPAEVTPKAAAKVAVTPTAATPGVGTPPAAGSALTQQMGPYIGNVALPKGRIFPLPGISFQPGSLSLTPGSETTITELATLLKTYPRLQVQLIGYANDAQGGLTNKSLSFKRVNQIKQQLTTAGIDYLRIDAIGRGTGVTRNRTDSLSMVRPTLRKIDLKVVVK
jgi:outer membrane protein OmpA-like peptidoglycan-associated protein